MKTQVRGQEVGCGIPVPHVERYVIQLLYFHLSPFSKSVQIPQKIPRAGYFSGLAASPLI
jgi:hypothetical protein